MVGADIFGRVSAWLDEYLEPMGMGAAEGPLRVARELVHGMVFTQSVQLSNAARLYCQTPDELAWAVQRMSRHLADLRWDHRDWAAAILAQAAAAVGVDDLMALDATELAKPYARQMEHLCTVRDASRPGDPLVNGYWCWGAYHWSPRHDTLAPVMLRPYSSTSPEFRSENDHIIRWMWTLREALGGKSIWAIDRGGDRPEILSALRMQPRWVVRVREDRGLLGPDGTRRPAGAWADEALRVRDPRGGAVTLPVSLPPPEIRHADLIGRLYLVVPTHGFLRNGQPDRWVLLTRGLIDGHMGPRQVRHQYALRWRAEDGKRFLGQLWHIERFLTRSWPALERMLWCLTLAGGYLAWLSRAQSTTAGQLQEEVLYHRKACKLPGYRLARGLHSVALQGTPGLTMLQNA